MTPFSTVSAGRTHLVVMADGLCGFLALENGQVKRFEFCADVAGWSLREVMPSGHAVKTIIDPWFGRVRVVADRAGDEIDLDESQD